MYQVKAKIPIAKIDSYREIMLKEQDCSMKDIRIKVPDLRLISLMDIIFIESGMGNV